jgi:hypothetical protein
MVGLIFAIVIAIVIAKAVTDPTPVDDLSRSVYKERRRTSNKFLLAIMIMATVIFLIALGEGGVKTTATPTSRAYSSETYETPSDTEARLRLFEIGQDRLREQQKKPGARQ